MKRDTVIIICLFVLSYFDLAYLKCLFEVLERNYSTVRDRIKANYSHLDITEELLVSGTQVPLPFVNFIVKHVQRAKADRMY